MDSLTQQVSECWMNKYHATWPLAEALSILMGALKMDLIAEPGGSGVFGGRLVP